LGYYEHEKKDEIDGSTPVTVFPFVKCEYAKYYPLLKEHEFIVKEMNREAASDLIPHTHFRDNNELYNYKQNLLFTDKSLLVAQENRLSVEILCLRDMEIMRIALCDGVNNCVRI